jgi:hypothetical protein
VSTLADAQWATIRRIRREVVTAGELNSVGGPSCGVTSEEIAATLGWPEFYGAYRVTDESMPEHAWNVMPDGTIVDATADQFGGQPVTVIPPGDPRAARYLDQDGDDDT